MRQNWKICYVVFTVPRKEQACRYWRGYKENAIEVRRGRFGLSLDAGYDQTPANAACAWCTYTYICTYCTLSIPGHVLTTCYTLTLHLTLMFCAILRTRCPSAFTFLVIQLKIFQNTLPSLFLWVIRNICDYLYIVKQTRKPLSYASGHSWQNAIILLLLFFQFPFVFTKFFKQFIHALDDTTYRHKPAAVIQMFIQMSVISEYKH